MSLNTKKVCVSGNSHFNRIKKNSFSNFLSYRNAYLSFLGSSTIKMLKHLVELIEDKPNVIIIHVPCSNITRPRLNTVDPSKLADDIVNIGTIYANYGKIIYGMIL